MSAPGTGKTILQLVLHETACEARLLGPDGSIVAHEIDESLGSADAVDPVAQFLSTVFEGVHGVGLRRTPASWNRLWEIARNVIGKVAAEDAATVREEFPGPVGAATRLLEVELSREGVEEMLAPFLDKAVALVERVLAGRNLTDPPEFDLDGDTLPLSFVAERLWGRYGPGQGERLPESLPPVTQAVTAGPPPVSAPPLPPELTARAEHLAGRAAPYLGRVHPDDRSELEAALAAATTARNSRDAEALSAALNDLDGLIFLAIGPDRAAPV